MSLKSDVVFSCIYSQLNLTSLCNWLFIRANSDTFSVFTLGLSLTLTTTRQYIIFFCLFNNFGERYLPFRIVLIYYPIAFLAAGLNILPFFHRWYEVPFQLCTRIFMHCVHQTIRRVTVRASYKRYCL